MDLKTHLAETGLDAAAFAARIGVSKEAIRLWVLGERTPRPEMMRRIVDATHGAVTPNDFLSSASSPSEVAE